MLSLLAVFGAVSALDPSLTFHYVKYPRVFRRNEVACQVCYGEFDCLSMDQCGYNAAAAEILNEENVMNVVNDALTAKVDSMMYDLVLEDSLKEYNECIPLISSYTTCNKDNICLGCKTCGCDETGHWNCSDTQKCSSALLNVDHQILTSVVERLKSASRYKRSYEAVEESSTRSVFDELADLMYVSQPMKAYTIKATGHSTTIAPTTKSSRRSNGENNNNLAFDDILSNDNLEQWIKSCDKENDESKQNENSDSRQFLRILKNIEEGIDDKVQIDNPARNIELLKDFKQYLKENSNVNESASFDNDQPNSINAIMTDIDDFDFEKQPSYINSVATVVKRNAKGINETTTRNETFKRNKTVQQNETSTFTNETENLTYSEKELRHILDIVNMLISNERKEINHLNYVKDNLLKFLRQYKNYSSLSEVHKKHSMTEDNSKKHLNWKVDMLNFYMSNLKKDVKDTIRDIYAIQKLKNLGAAPGTGNILKLKTLLFALTSYYLNNSRGYQHTKKRSSLPYKFSPVLNTSLNDISRSINLSDKQPTYSEPQRRLFEPTPDNVYKVKLIKRALTRMLVMIDNDTPSISVLSPLKPKINNIFNRIIIELHKKPPIHPFIRDTNFNLTKTLTTLIEEWQNVPNEVHNVSPADRLHNMKLLHLTLSQGIDKLKDALISIQFGYSRRMSFIEEGAGKDLASDASKFLSNIDERIKNFVLNADISKVTPKRKDEVKKTMWSHLKKALSNSKHGLLKYFQNKFHKPKSYIVNDMVRKRVEEVNRRKFLEVMKRWQENFDNYQGRHKRSVKQFSKRMKNILPKYLRQIKTKGRINPTLYANKLAGKTNNKIYANEYAETSKYKVHTNMNKFAGTKKDKVHADGKKVTGTSTNKVHTKGNEHIGGTSKNKSGNTTAFAETRKDKVHAAVNDNKKHIVAAHFNQTELKNSTTKRGVRTQGYHNITEI